MKGLGIDTGNEGAAVLVRRTPPDRDRVIAVARWWPRGTGSSRVWDGSIAAGDLPSNARHGMTRFWMVGSWLSSELGPLLLGADFVTIAAELPYVGKNAQGALRLARGAGAVVAPLERHASTMGAKWVQPDEWRRDLFRAKWWKLNAEELGGTPSRGVEKRTGRPFVPKRVAAKREAERLIPSLVDGDIDRMVAKLGGGLEHVCDATGIALWGMRE